MTRQGCEWSPTAGRLAVVHEPDHAEATWRVGTGLRTVFLCDACAALPRFARLRSRVRLRPPAAPAVGGPMPAIRAGDLVVLAGFGPRVVPAYAVRTLQGNDGVDAIYREPLWRREDR